MVKGFEGLPGAQRIEAGLRDLDEERLTEDALLVLIGAQRLRDLGIDVPTATTVENPEHRLYERLAEADDLAAHSRYNALIRLLVSFERAAARAQSEAAPASPAAMVGKPPAFER